MGYGLHRSFPQELIYSSGSWNRMERESFIVTEISVSFDDKMNVWIFENACEDE